MEFHKNTLILKATESFDEAARAVRAGGVVAYPTETCYGLGVDPFNSRALDRLFRLKGRSQANPVSVIIADMDMLASVTSAVSPAASALMERFWPGPLTIIFTAAPDVPATLVAGTGKIGVRISSSSVCARLMEAVGSPLTSTSANPAGRAPAASAPEVLGYFDGEVDVVIDGGVLSTEAASTVVDATGESVVVLREGVVSASEVLKAVG